MSRGMDVVVNGAPRTLPPDTTVADVVCAVGADPAGSAVAVNDEVVPRRAWPATRLGAGDRVEILTAVPGG